MHMNERIKLFVYLNYTNTTHLVSVGNLLSNLPVSRAVRRSSLDREVIGSNLEPVKSGTVLPTVRSRCDISSKEAVLPGRNGAEMGSANLLHVSAYYSEYNERFAFGFTITMGGLFSSYARKSLSFLRTLRCSSSSELSLNLAIFRFLTLHATN